MQRWIGTERGNLFQLTNKMIQFVFNDKTEIILTVKTNLYIYTDKNKVKTILTISSAIKSSNKEMIEKLEYIIKILEEMTNKGSEKK